jgi:two-component system, LytTR family, response regulator
MADSSKMQCLIIDKDTKSAKQLQAIIKSIPQLDLMRLCTRMEEAMNLVSELAPKIIFIDAACINPPDEDLLSQVAKTGWKVVITSQRKEDAVHAFNADAVDFLLKPVSEMHLTKTLARILKHQEKNSNGKVVPKSLFVKSGTNYEKVLLKEIYYIDYRNSTLHIYTNNRLYAVKGSVKEILSHLPEKDFIQIHKSGIARVDRIKSIEEDSVQIEGRKESISLKFREALLEKLYLA